MIKLGMPSVGDATPTYELLSPDGRCRLCGRKDRHQPSVGDATPTYELLSPDGRCWLCGPEYRHQKLA